MYKRQSPLPAHAIYLDVQDAQLEQAGAAEEDDESRNGQGDRREERPPAKKQEMREEASHEQASTATATGTHGGVFSENLVWVGFPVICFQCKRPSQKPTTKKLFAVGKKVGPKLPPTFTLIFIGLGVCGLGLGSSSVS